MMTLVTFDTKLDWTTTGDSTMSEWAFRHDAREAAWLGRGTKAAAVVVGRTIVEVADAAALEALRSLLDFLAWCPDCRERRDECECSSDDGACDDGDESMDGDHASALESVYGPDDGPDDDGGDW